VNTPVVPDGKLKMVAFACGGHARGTACPPKRLLCNIIFMSDAMKKASKGLTKSSGGLNIDEIKTILNQHKIQVPPNSERTDFNELLTNLIILMETKYFYVLVVCSDEHGSDFLNQQNQDMIKKLANGLAPVYDFLNGEHAFPDNLPDKQYDLIWFAGCNMLAWIFPELDLSGTIKKLEQSLNAEGNIIFTESLKYVKHTNAKTTNLSLGLEDLHKVHAYKHMHELQTLWYKTFRSVTINGYNLYQQI
jgi:hypothetical protein